MTPSAPTGLTPRRELLLLLTLAGIQFTNVLDFMIIMPLGPQFIHLFGISSAQFGVLVSAYTFAAGASGLLAATYIDRLDRKTLLLVLYGGFALSTLACALAPTYGTLLGARVAAGLFGGVLMALAQTIVGDVIPFERRGRAMGVVMSAFSASTVAGIPLGLWIANRWSWHMPFVAIAVLSALLIVFAALTLPPLRGHLDGGSVRGGGFAQRLASVLGHAGARRAMMFTALNNFAGFTVIPFITVYLTANARLAPDVIPLVYLVGGAATLLSARLIGRSSDQYGKVPTYSVLAVGMAVPLMATTLITPAWPLAAVLVVTTLFFTLVSGRMIPAMAILTAATAPAVRGTFMTLNSAVQSAAMGAASFVAGLIVTQDSQGLLHNYPASALLGILSSLGALLLARRLTLHTSD
ncbi:MFS transporter [Amphibiibacter pelophylacis]|uniref:MFS transporter n=1 Tax=Amphibiibacter pelophylacis TaxID=1799477 RepID=A0ACC6P2Y0_9BURK